MKVDKVFVYRQNRASVGASRLANELGVRMIKSEGSKFVDSPSKAVINWGSGSDLAIETERCRVINPPAAVSNATNKRRFFELCRDAGNVSIPRFTTSKMEAEDWVRNGASLFARTILQGSGGAGIVEVDTVDQLTPIHEGTLLVEYIKKRHEFRVHVGGADAIDVQQKLKRKEVNIEKVNYRVRNLANGFIFARREVKVPEQVMTEAKKVIPITGLDFGAVDVVYNERQNRAYVLEVNTAPGLEGTTINSYAHFFRGLLDLEKVRSREEEDIRREAREMGIELDDE